VKRAVCRARRVTVAAWALILPGCGIVAPAEPDFSATVERGANEQPLLLDDILAITGSMMTPDEQRQALRDMGIEDEDLIEALVAGL